jgi:hypothetical protein
MPSLKQRIEAAAHEFIVGVLGLIRTAPLGEVTELMSPAFGAFREELRHEATPPVLPARKHARSQRGKPAGRDTRRARTMPAPARKLDTREDGPPPPGDFDVTTPELLLVGESAAIQAGGNVSVEAATIPAAPTEEPPAADPASALAPPPERARHEASLRPGESVARSNGAGIVIRRTKRSKNRV